MEETQTLIENLVADGRLEEAIDQYTDFCREKQHHKRAKDAIGLSGRYSELREQQRNGIISQADYQLERSRISHSLLDLVQQMPEDFSKPYQQEKTVAEVTASRHTMPEQKPQSGNNKVLLFGIGLAILLGIIVIQYISGPKTNGALPNEPGNTSAQEGPPQRQTPAGSISTGTLPNTRDGKFRSFGNTIIRDDMERGYIDGRYAFKNVRTKAILCCYDDAKDFSGGKAWVKAEGKEYYIDKSGNPAK